MRDMSFGYSLAEAMLVVFDHTVACRESQAEVEEGLWIDEREDLGK